MQQKRQHGRFTLNYRSKSPDDSLAGAFCFTVRLPVSPADQLLNIMGDLLHKRGLLCQR